MICQTCKRKVYWEPRIEGWVHVNVAHLIDNPHVVDVYAYREDGKSTREEEMVK